AAGSTCSAGGWVSCSMTAVHRRPARGSRKSSWRLYATTARWPCCSTTRTRSLSCARSSFRLRDRGPGSSARFSSSPQRGEGSIPLPAQRAARERVRALPQPLRFALGVAAVLGPDMDRSALATLVDLEAVSGLQRAGFLEAVGSRLHFPQLAVAREAERALT